MIAAFIDSLKLDKLPFNWFDVTVLLVLVMGLVRGRKNGMSKEVLRTFQWLALVLVCGFFYETAAQLLINTTAWSKLNSYLAGYLILACLVWLVFAVLKKALRPSLTGTNLFGNGEYYLGMMSGMVRFACIIFFALALLNAPTYSSTQIAAQQAYMKRWFGGGVYGGNYIPNLPTVQDSVFKKSFVGPYIKDYLGQLLINTGSPEPPPSKPAPKAGVVTIQR